MNRVPLIFPLGLTLFFLLFSSTLIPYIKLSPLSIFLAFLYHRYPLEKCLWISALSGLSLDLLNADARLGIHALTLTLTTLLIYKQKHHFFEDKPLALALFTLPISILWTSLEWLVMPLSGLFCTFSPSLFVTDLFVMPLVDTLYAWLLFCLPLSIYAQVKTVGWKTYFYERQQKYPALARLLPKRLRFSLPIEVEL